jgi:hypothetical protein
MRFLRGILGWLAISYCIAALLLILDAVSHSLDSWRDLFLGSIDFGKPVALLLGIFIISGELLHRSRMLYYLVTFPIAAVVGLYVILLPVFTIPHGPSVHFTFFDYSAPALVGVIGGLIGGYVYWLMAGRRS